MKSKAYTNPILVVSLVLAVALASAGIGCGAATPLVSNTDSPVMMASSSLSVSGSQNNTIATTIINVASIEERLHSRSAHAEWTEERRVARYTERTVPERWR